MSKSQSNLLSALEQARQNVFRDDLFISEEGEVTSASHQQVPNPIVTEIIPCLSCGATLYVIAGDCTKGTWVHQHDL